MQKSQLRKIIRKSINEITTEHLNHLGTGPGFTTNGGIITSHGLVEGTICDSDVPSSTHLYPPISFNHQVGDTIDITNLPGWQSQGIVKPNNQLLTQNDIGTVFKVTFSWGGSYTINFKLDYFSMGNHLYNFQMKELGIGDCPGWEEISCQCCVNGYPQTISTTVQANQGCSVLNGGGNSNCSLVIISGGASQNPCTPIYGCMDPNATNYDTTATINDYSCVFEPDSCDKVVWLNHINTNYPQINDPSTNLQLAHFCEYCIDGTISPSTNSFCECCPDRPRGGDGPCQPPRGGCPLNQTWDPIVCKCKEGIGPIREEVERFQKLANIKK